MPLPSGLQCLLKSQLIHCISCPLYKGNPIKLSAGFSFFLLLLVFSLYHHFLFIVCLDMDFLGFILLGALWFLDLDVFFLPQIRKFSALISSNKFSASFSLSSSGIPIKWILLCLMLLHSYLNLFSFIIIIFVVVAVQVGCLSLSWLPDCWSILLLPLICCWLHLVHF